MSSDYKKVIDIEFFLKLAHLNPDANDSKKIFQDEKNKLEKLVFNFSKEKKTIIAIHKFGVYLNSDIPPEIHETTFYHVNIHLIKMLLACPGIGDVVYGLAKEYFNTDKLDLQKTLIRAITNNYDYVLSESEIDDMESMKKVRDFFLFEHGFSDEKIYNPTEKASPLFIALVESVSDELGNSQNKINEICNRMKNKKLVNDPNFFLMLNTADFVYFFVREAEKEKEKDISEYCNTILYKFYLTADLNLFFVKTPLELNEKVLRAKTTVNLYKKSDIVKEYCKFLREKGCLIKESFASNFYSVLNKKKY